MRSPRRIALLVAVVATLLAAGWMAYCYRTRPRLLSPPMVQMVTPEGFTLVWQMYPPQEASVRISPPDGQRPPQYAALQRGDRHMAQVCGLEPGRVYQYEISTRQGCLARDAVRTAAAPDQAFRFIAFGDSGDGRAPQRRLAERMPRYDPDLIIHTGDVVYGRGEKRDYRMRFYLPYQRLLGRTPFYPCLGNHDIDEDGGQRLLDTFLLPQNGPPGQQPERCYWFDYGPARFIAIDSNGDEPALQQVVAPWLDQVLAAAGGRWKIVFFHEPPFTNGRYHGPPKIVNTIVPLLDRHQVELVLCGHDHMYQRTFPLRAGQPVFDGRGTAYVITAAGGARLYDFRLPRPDYIAAWCNDRHSFTVADVTRTMIMLRQVDVYGDVIDTACITRTTHTPSQSPRNAGLGGSADTHRRLMMARGS